MNSHMRLYLILYKWIILRQRTWVILKYLKFIPASEHFDKWLHYSVHIIQKRQADSKEFSMWMWIILYSHLHIAYIDDYAYNVVGIYFLFSYFMLYWNEKIIILIVGYYLSLTSLLFACNQNSADGNSTFQLIGMY